MFRGRSLSARSFTALGAGLLAAVIVPSAAWAGNPAKPTVVSFTASPTSITTSNGTVTLSATVTNATSCTFSAKPTLGGLPATVPCTSTATEQVVMPLNTSSKKTASYKFHLSLTGPGGTKKDKKAVKVTVAPGEGGGNGKLDGVTSVVSSGGAYCAVSSSGGVDCWGDTFLGDGNYNESATPVPVEGVGGTGTLTGVISLVSDSSGFCALITTGGVDCWGAGDYGQLGNGAEADSAFPVAVEGLGTGSSTDVASLVTQNSQGAVSEGNHYCAILTIGEVVCWGTDTYGALGDSFVIPYAAVPRYVAGVGGSGQLTDVTAVTGDGLGFCALVTSGEVDCWGYGYDGELGNGSYYTTGNEGSYFPVTVNDASGALTGVASLASDNSGYCAVLTTSGVDCWGYGYDGELGNGTSVDSDIAVSVEGVGGSGNLSGVSAFVPEDNNAINNNYCAILSSGGVDCWGYGEDGELGDGTYYSANATTPVSVIGVGGTGTLAGVSGGTDTGFGSCVLLSSSDVDCWGYGNNGELGNGTFYGTPDTGSATPVSVAGVGGTGTLSGVTSLASGVGAPIFSTCAVLSSGEVDCWGYGYDGELGDGNYYTTGNMGSATPVAVIAPSS